MQCNFGNQSLQQLQLIVYFLNQQHFQSLLSCYLYSSYTYTNFMIVLFTSQYKAPIFLVLPNKFISILKAKVFPILLSTKSKDKIWYYNNWLLCNIKNLIDLLILSFQLFKLQRLSFLYFFFKGLLSIGHHSKHLLIYYIII